MVPMTALSRSFRWSDEVVFGHHVATHPLPHLRRCRVGEGDGGYLAYLVGAEEGDIALDQDAGLAGAGTGGDDDVAVDVCDDGCLLGGEIHCCHFQRENSLTRQACLKAQ